jgi:L-rhamnose isomerase
MTRDKIESMIESALYAKEYVARMRYVHRRKVLDLPIDSPLSAEDAIKIAHKYDVRLISIQRTLTDIRTNAQSFYDREQAHKALMTIATHKEG